MNTQQVKVYKVSGLTSIWFMPFVKIATGKNTIEFRQLFLFSRIIISIFIGLIGYSFDRFMKLIQKPPVSV